MAPKIAVVYYSMYGHVKLLAEAEKRGVEAAGGKADLYQSDSPRWLCQIFEYLKCNRIQEILPADVLEKMRAAPKDYMIPIAKPSDLEKYDGFLFGSPTRYGTFPSQWTAFWESTEPQWRSHAYAGKLAGAFVCCGSLGSGMEMTIANMLPTFVHHGLTFVTMGVSMKTFWAAARFLVAVRGVLELCR